MTFVVLHSHRGRYVPLVLLVQLRRSLFRFRRFFPFGFVFLPEWTEPFQNGTGFFELEIHVRQPMILPWTTTTQLPATRQTLKSYFIVRFASSKARHFRTATTAYMFSLFVPLRLRNTVSTSKSNNKHDPVSLLWLSRSEFILLCCVYNIIILYIGSRTHTANGDGRRRFDTESVKPKRTEKKKR